MSEVWSVEGLCEAAVAEVLSRINWPVRVAVVPLVVALAQEPDEVMYPAVEFAAEPFSEVKPGAGFGEVRINFAVRSHVDDDVHGRQVDGLSALVWRGVSSAAVGECLSRDVRLCGLKWADDGGVRVNDDSRTFEKSFSLSFMVRTGVV